MKFHVIRQQTPNRAQSPVRVVEQTTGGAAHSETTGAPPASAPMGSRAVMNPDGGPQKSGGNKAGPVDDNGTLWVRIVETRRRERTITVAKCCGSRPVWGIPEERRPDLLSVDMASLGQLRLVRSSILSTVLSNAYLRRP